MSARCHKSMIDTRRRRRSEPETFFLLMSLERQSHSRGGFSGRLRAFVYRPMMNLLYSSATELLPLDALCQQFARVEPFMSSLLSWSLINMLETENGVDYLLCTDTVKICLWEKANKDNED